MSEQSGTIWCGRFPTSYSTDDLIEPFRTRAEDFIDALKEGGVKLTISATLRPPERAYLMHWAWMIAHELVLAGDVPPMPGVDIDWIHRAPTGEPDHIASVEAAQHMVEEYNIAYQPSLTSRHTKGRAIDMTLTWYGGVQIIDRHGGNWRVGAPYTGLNSSIIEVGKTFGVYKLLSDPPHWSDDGH
jgi:hypothetical protein